MNNFIDEEKIHSLIKQKENPIKSEIKRALNKALQLKGLDLEEVAALVSIKDKGLLKELFKTAFQIKNEIYGSRLVLFAPLYTSNHCSNNCLYCGFRKDNKGMKRRCLTIDEIKQETKLILQQGHKRILMLMGESSKE